MWMNNEKRLSRGAGILLPVSSLPSPYGIGSFGRSAYEFVDFLRGAGQCYWQVLPMGPTGYGDSPYQSFSAFAGNPYFIDLPTLHEQGLLTDEELHSAVTCDTKVDYEKMYRTRFSLLRIAATRFSKADPDFLAFANQEEEWLDDYALYMSIKKSFDEKPWTEWDKDIRLRDMAAMKRYRELLNDDVFFWKFCQFQFFKQWTNLKQYANDNGVLIIGDIPIYVAADSADVWKEPQLFELDEEGFPVSVAGVPPDCFSAEGQRWGNPLYRYDVMEKDGFSWWKRRMSHCARLYDVIRIDHFIGISRYYAIPAESRSAAQGEWRIGPGEKLTGALESVLNGSKILAEDLGILHPSVKELLRKTGYPGMRVLLFAFDGNPHNAYLSHNYCENTIVYGGTHDNETIVGYCEHVEGYERYFLLEYLGIEDVKDVPVALIRMAYQSVADVVIFQMQDILQLNNDARMNTPSTLGGNWEWRLTAEQLKNAPAGQLRHFTDIYGRRRENGS